jgi:hypothetical protein
MARLSNANEGLLQGVGRKPKRQTYGRRSRNKSLPNIYDVQVVPLSPTKSQQRRSWTSIHSDRSARQIEDGRTPPSSTQKILAKSSPVSSSSPKRLRDSTKVGSGPRPIANESAVQSNAPALQTRTASSSTRIQLRSKLPPKPKIFERNTLKSAAGETSNEHEFLTPDINQLTTGVENVLTSDDHIKASTAADNLNLGTTDDTEMAEIDGEGDRGEVKQSLAHTGDSDDEYFDVEDIKSCKLDSRVRILGVLCIYSNHNSLLLGDGPPTSQVEGL